MSHRPLEPSFNFNDDIAETQLSIKNPKSNKAKFLKDLNHRMHLSLRSEKRNNKQESNSKEKEFPLSKERSRKNTQAQMKSLLQKIIPGARIIKADWKDNKLNGIVEIQYDNGNQFVGKYQNGVRVEGKMQYVQINCQYNGSFFAQKFAGYGKLSYIGGRTIQGEWDNMELIGNATITYPNKDVYYGPVNQKLYKHGDGYLFLHNGYKYVGTFKHGSISGIGGYFKDDKLVIRGLWQKGNLIKEIANQNEIEGIQCLTRAPYFKQSMQDNLSLKFKGFDSANQQSFAQKSNQSFASQTDSIFKSKSSLIQNSIQNKKKIIKVRTSKSKIALQLS